MKNIALVTDSTADLPREIIQSNHVNVIPLKVIFGNETLLDSHISPAEFYERLAVEETLPKTSQPTVDEFVKLYEKLLKKYETIISIHISSALSGTLNSAHLAKEKIEGPIHLVDSKNISLGAGFMVIEAARCIGENFSPEKILQHLQEVRENTLTMFTLDTMEYLYRGGRIGKASSLLGAMLNIKPIIRVNEEGIYVPHGKARSQKGALQNIVQACQNWTRGKPPLRLGIAHGKAEKTAKQLAETMENLLDIPVNIFAQVGPVIGVHTGPGTLGIALQRQA